MYFPVQMTKDRKSRADCSRVTRQWMTMNDGLNAKTKSQGPLTCPQKKPAAAGNLSVCTPSEPEPKLEHPTEVAAPSRAHGTQKR